MESLQSIPAVLSYRGRAVSETDVSTIRELIRANPQASRRVLSKKLCELWNWRQENGSTRDMVCRGLMLALHRAGHIELPPHRARPNNPFLRRRRPSAVDLDRTPITCRLAELGPLELRPVRRRPDETLFDGLLQAHHYLGYVQPVGEHLKILVYAAQRPVACFAWSSAPRHLGPRDRFLGWSREARRKNIRFVAYNSRFLIVPWVRVPHLASHLLGWMCHVLSEHWERLYAHPVYFAETFIDPPRYAGTCYRAANWVFLGRTTGRGNNDKTNRPNRSLKDVLGLPLCRQFRKKLMETW